jgi:hypothetical protein
MTGLHPHVNFACGVPLLALYCWMLTERVSSRIRNSSYWFFGWLGALLILSTGGRLVLPVFNMLLDGTGMKDEQIVPWMLTAMILVIAVMYARILYKLHREAQPYRQG